MVMRDHLMNKSFHFKYIYIGIKHTKVLEEFNIIIISKQKKNKLNPEFHIN